jgi:hypothetical protein
MTIRNTWLLQLVLLSACTSNTWEGAYIVDKEALKKEVQNSIEGNALASSLGSAMLNGIVDNATLIYVIKGDSIFSTGSIGNELGEYSSAKYVTEGDVIKFKNKKGDDIQFVKNDTGFSITNDQDGKSKSVYFIKVSEDEEAKYTTQMIKLREELKERERIRKELEGIISVTIVKKGDYEYEYRDYFTFDLQVVNNSHRSITAFSGALTISDLLGNELKTVSWTYDDGIEASTTHIEAVQIDYSEYNTHEKLIRDKPLDKLKVSWTTSKVLFKNGEKLGE